MGALQMAVLLAENGSAFEAAWSLRSHQEQLRFLVAELEAAEKARMAAALKTLSGDIARYYEELSPGHHIKISGITSAIPNAARPRWRRPRTASRSTR